MRLIACFQFRRLVLPGLFLLLAGRGWAEEPFAFARTPGKLPKTVVPMEYSVMLVPDLERGTFRGTMRVTLDVRAAVPALVLMGLWASVGGSRMIILLAGLQDVPKELLEAAEMDGANSWTKFWKVTLPMVSPTLFFNLVLGIIFALRTFETAFITTNGGPARATWFISLHIYQSAFVTFDMGYASALSWLFMLILFVITYSQFKLSGQWVFYPGEKQ